VAVIRDYSDVVSGLRDGGLKDKLDGSWEAWITNAKLPWYPLERRLFICTGTSPIRIDEIESTSQTRVQNEKYIAIATDCRLVVIDWGLNKYFALSYASFGGYSSERLYSITSPLTMSHRFTVKGKTDGQLSFVVHPWKPPTLSRVLSALSDTRPPDEPKTEKKIALLNGVNHWLAAASNASL
jgi:hypothetical protein